MLKKFAVLLLVCAISACGFFRKEEAVSTADEPQVISNVEVQNARIKPTRKIVVCREKQCAPAHLSMSKEYIYNSMQHLLSNNNHKTALVCEADYATHTCTENYITMPIKVGVTPAYMYIDSVKITDISVEKGKSALNLLLNYNVTYNGQSPECLPSKTLMFIKDVNNIIVEDAGYSCKMTTIGKSTVKTLFVVDYIDLDYGFIGGFYSIGTSGPAYGGGTGYMLIRLPKNAYPLDPSLLQDETRAKKADTEHATTMKGAKTKATGTQTKDIGEGQVEVFPIKK